MYTSTEDKVNSMTDDELVKYFQEHREMDNYGKILKSLREGIKYHEQILSKEKESPPEIIGERSKVHKVNIPKENEELISEIEVATLNEFRKLVPDLKSVDVKEADIIDTQSS